MCGHFALEVVGFKTLGFASSVADHRGMVFDITTASFPGKYESRIVRAGCRWLHSKNKGSVVKYCRCMEDQLSHHKMRERQLALDLEIGDDDTSPQQRQKTNQLDVQLTEM